MSRKLSTAAAALLVLSLAGAAHATSAKWCFHWQASYEDAGFGEDYLNDPLPSENVIAAKYAYTYIRKWNSLTNSWVPLWNNWMDSTGCTGNVEVLPGTKYGFFQFLWLKRSTRYVDVHADGDSWSGSTEYYYSELTTASPLVVEPSYDAPMPPDSGNNRLMPAITQFLANASTLDYPDGNHIEVSSWDSEPPAGAICSGTGITDVGSHFYHLCVSDAASDEKFKIVHELGHAVSHENESFTWGWPQGSEGAFNAGAYCDCSLTAPGQGHCPTSREFMGKGQLEGFSNFISAASMNTRSHVSGWFVFYKDLHEPTADHYDDFPGMLEDPSTDKGSTTPFPVETPLSTGSNLKWVNYECDPGSSLDIYLRGNEWDWLEFFWNLYTDGSNKYEVSEINDIWNYEMENDDRMIVCCDTADVCNSYQFGVHGVLSCASPRPHEIEVGLKWADIETYVHSIYGSAAGTKGNNFTSKGVAAGVSAY